MGYSGQWRVESGEWRVTGDSLEEMNRMMEAAGAAFFGFRGDKFFSAADCGI